MTFHITEDEQQRERRMLKEIKSEPYLKMASNIRKRRERIPKIDMDSNPFCASRQLRDEYMLQNFNRNPRFYDSKLLSSPRIEKNLHNYSAHQNAKQVYGKKTRKNVQASPRDRAEFVAIPPASGMTPSYSTPVLKPNNVMDNTANYLENKASYSTTTMKTATFGHRPESAARHMDPLTGNFAKMKRPVLEKSKRKSKNPTGMSAANLVSLLNTNTKPVDPPKLRKPKRKKKKPYIDYALMEAGFSTHCPTETKKRECRTLNAPDPDTSVAELIQKFRHLSSGVPADYII